MVSVIYIMCTCSKFDIFQHKIEKNIEFYDNIKSRKPVGFDDATVGIPKVHVVLIVQSWKSVQQ